MKKMVVFICYLCVCLVSNAQGNNQLNEMINECLLQYLDHSGISPYICLDNYPDTFSFSEDILKKDVKFMSLHNLHGQRELKRKKEYPFLFTAIELENNKIKISIFRKTVVLHSKNQLQIQVADWGVFTYEYSCSQSNWKLREHIFGGI